MTYPSVRDEPPFGSVEARIADFRGSVAVLPKAYGCIQAVIEFEHYSDQDRVRLIRNILTAEQAVVAERVAAALTPDDVSHDRHAEDCPGGDGPCVCPESVE